VSVVLPPGPPESPPEPDDPAVPLPEVPLPAALELCEPPPVDAVGLPDDDSLPHATRSDAAASVLVRICRRAEGRAE
jgi:hypothetical protein